MPFIILKNPQKTTCIPPCINLQGFHYELSRTRWLRQGDLPEHVVGLGHGRSHSERLWPLSPTQSGRQTVWGGFVLYQVSVAMHWFKLTTAAQIYVQIILSLIVTHSFLQVLSISRDALIKNNGKENKFKFEHIFIMLEHHAYS